MPDPAPPHSGSGWADLQRALLDERRQSRSLAGRLEQLERVLDALPLALWRCDFPVPLPTDRPADQVAEEFIRTGRIGYANRAAAQLHGLPAEALLGSRIYEPPASRCLPDPGNLRRFVAEGFHLADYELQPVLAPGPEHSYRCTWFGLMDEGRLSAAWAVAENVTAERELRERLAAAQESTTEELVGRSDAIRRVLAKIEQVAPTDSTVLILGETGTGKELIARAIHARSRRAGKPLVAVNCGAIASGLVESELFGHEKGAFTGALSRKIGRFELADGGSLFLDEIGDLPLDLQVKLLRVLQEGEFTRVGGTQPLKVDVRVIAATHRDLPQLVRAGGFRQDLYYRLNVFPLRTPPLRERREDIPVLANHFARRYGAKLGKRIETIPPTLLDMLQSHPWPGNIRELANIIERSVIVTEGTTLQLAEWVTGQYNPITPVEGPSSLQTLEEIERAHIVRTLERTGWKVSGPDGAAAALNLKPTTLEARMKKLGIVRPK